MAMMIPVPQRNVIVWIILSIVTFGLAGIIYMIINFSDLEKFARQVQQRSNVVINVPTGILVLIPIVNIWMLMQKYDILNLLLNASGLQIHDRVMSGLMILIMMFIPFIGWLVLLIQFFKWQGLMNQASIMLMSGN